MSAWTKAQLAERLRQRADEIAEVLYIKSCHISGEHDPTHTPRYYCSWQRSELLDRVLHALELETNDLPRRPDPFWGDTDEVRAWIEKGVKV